MILVTKNHTDATATRLPNEALTLIAENIASDNLGVALVALDSIAKPLDHGNAAHKPFKVLQDLLTDLIEAKEPSATIEPRSKTKHKIFLHKDIRSARDSALRVSLSLIVFGSLWIVTGIEVLGFMLLGLAVMLSVFSNFENPAIFMRNVVMGQVFGILGALTCHWLLWPMASSEWQMIAMMLPFILFAPLLVGHRKTVIASFDYSMVSLLLLSPQFPLSGSFMLSLGQSLAVLSAPIIAILAYTYIFPATTNRKVGHLVSMMIADIEAMARDHNALNRRTTWRARFYHRALLLLRQSTLVPRFRGQAHEINSAVLTLGQLVMKCHEQTSAPAGADNDAVVAQEILKQSQTLASKPDLLASVLQKHCENAQSNKELFANAALSARFLAQLKAA